MRSETVFKNGKTKKIKQIWQKDRNGNLDDQIQKSKLTVHRNSLVIQWLGLGAPNAGDPGFIPGSGTKILHAMLLLSRFSHVQLCDPMDYSPQGSSVHGILQAGILEYCSGLPFPSPEDLPNPGIELGSQQLLLQLLLSLLSCSSQPPLGKKRTLSKLRSYTKEVPL